MDKKEVLSLLKQFHGHLGPYAVVGYRMGILAVERLHAGHKKLFATVKTGTKPPISCIIDGIQLSSGCTLGKGNIRVTDEMRAEAIFERKEDSQRITLKLKDDIKHLIDTKTTKDNEEIMAESIFDMRGIFDEL